MGGWQLPEEGRRALLVLAAVAALAGAEKNNLHSSFKLIFHKLLFITEVIPYLP